MKTFTVEISRRFVQHESASITVQAASKAEARRIAKAKMSDADSIAEKEWAPSDFWYDNHSIDEVEEA